MKNNWCLETSLYITWSSMISYDGLLFHNKRKRKYVIVTMISPRIM